MARLRRGLSRAISAAIDQQAGQGQHERIIEAVAARDRARLLEVIHEHRESTGAGARASLKPP